MTNLVGIDEAGRGALAGPLFVAACKLNNNLSYLKDSKQLSPKKRSLFYKEIIKDSNYFILSFSNIQIDNLGLSECLRIALRLIKKHFSNCDFVYDGNTNLGIKDINTMIKADSKILEVSAASILAKYSRDKTMDLLSIKYQNYDFLKNKGYGSKTHINAIVKFGYSNIHRKSFNLKCFENNLF